MAVHSMGRPQTFAEVFKKTRLRRRRWWCPWRRKEPDYGDEVLGRRVREMIYAMQEKTWVDGGDLKRVDVLVGPFGEVKLVFRKEFMK